MKTVASITELRRMAADTGASVRVAGQAINAGGAKVAVRVPRPVVVEPPPPPVVPAQPQGIAADDVRKMLAERDEAWERRIDALFAALMASDTKPKPPTWDFVVEYGPKHEIVGIKAVPV